MRQVLGRGAADAWVHIRERGIIEGAIAGALTALVGTVVFHLALGEVVASAAGGVALYGAGSLVFYSVQAPIRLRLDALSRRSEHERELHKAIVIGEALARRAPNYEPWPIYERDEHDDLVATERPDVVAFRAEWTAWEATCAPLLAEYPEFAREFATTPNLAFDDWARHQKQIDHKVNVLRGLFMYLYPHDPEQN